MSAHATSRPLDIAMLVPIAVATDADGQLRAWAPDLPRCDLRGLTEQEVLPRLRLALEAEITELLMAGERLPDTRAGSPPDQATANPDVRWLHIHINIAHLTALARHQAGR
ncbi:MAG: hypothetical protein R3F24_05040 [Gammaproteobacteria bacterium]